MRESTSTSSSSRVGLTIRVCHTIWRIRAVDMKHSYSTFTDVAVQGPFGSPQRRPEWTSSDLGDLVEVAEPETHDSPCRGRSVSFGRRFAGEPGVPAEREIGTPARSLLAFSIFGAKANHLEAMPDGPVLQLNIGTAVRLNVPPR
jgi:hypothetical protein